MGRILPRNFRFSLTATITSIVLSIVCFWCSSWQWERYKAKVALIATYDSQAKITPPTIDTANTSAETFKNLMNNRIRLSGTYDYAKQIIVTNRKHAAGPGHWLLTPLKLAGSDQYVIVSRGFIPFEDREPKSWEKYSFEAEETFDAVVKPSSTKKFLGPSNPEPTDETPYPTIWFFPEIDKLAALLPYPVISSVFLQRIGPPPHGQFPAQSILVEVPPQTHYGYTIEWILLGLASLAFGFLYQAFPRQARQVTVQNKFVNNEHSSDGKYN